MGQHLCDLEVCFKEDKPQEKSQGKVEEFNKTVEL